VKKPDKPVVLKLIARSKPIGDVTGPLRDGESPLSDNAVAGPTVSVPIAATCQPSKVCVGDCYAASNRMATPEAIAKQFRVQHSMDADPVAFAERVVGEYDRRGLTYLHWNGVGDLSPAAVAAINHIIATRPDVALWIVTRVASLAAQIEHGDRAFIHFSLDKSSLGRRDEFLALKPKSRNYFFSYQCEVGEVPPSGAELGASVIFFRRYKPTAGANLADPSVCPLNKLADCTGACAACRRCFNSAAVSMRSAFDPPAA
jgi:hypothetical protein